MIGAWVKEAYYQSEFRRDRSALYLDVGIHQESLVRRVKTKSEGPELSTECVCVCVR